MSMPPFNPLQSFKLGDQVKFRVGEQEFEGIVTELQPTWFLIGHIEDAENPLRRNIFYKAKDYGKISHVVIVKK